MEKEVPGYVLIFLTTTENDLLAVGSKDGYTCIAHSNSAIDRWTFIRRFEEFTPTDGRQ